ncbi:9dca7227-b251-4de3-9563-2e8c4d38e694 [Sclerotinia trifoliorum]|uniref:9dca7227-b251-4de3-9563-2e8c4d38e694 n=1 Tax=Sclerotinia trifoliorum TaxID=28548 RepID=A0A8H2VVL4_9HELO|nr:9dca7227-b251-4de3-9563-2e8c4d38e694 [Sclerotinia trifoliorum]
MGILYDIIQPHSITKPASFMIASTFFPILALIAVVLRFNVRRIQKTAPKSDDWIMIPAALLVIGMSICGILGVTKKIWGYYSTADSVSFLLQSIIYEAKASKKESDSTGLISVHPSRRASNNQGGRSIVLQESILHKREIHFQSNQHSNHSFCCNLGVCNGTRQYISVWSTFCRAVAYIIRVLAILQSYITSICRSFQHHQIRVGPVDYSTAITNDISFENKSRN